MTTGIYVLKFSGTNKVYIGQSVNIEVRYRVHKQKLKDGSHNYKMMEAYNKYGLPEIEILCECSREELNKYEAEAFEIYNSIAEGFNIASEPDIHQEGEKNGASRYSNEDIIKVFKMLIDPNNRYKDICTATGVSENTIRHVANGDAHTWLSVKFPEDYPKLAEIIRTQIRRALSGSAKSKGIEYPRVKAPDGSIHKVDNANAFARQHGMDSSYFIKLLNKKALSCKGWKLA